MSFLEPKKKATPVFLHGLDSSIRGTKGQWFMKHFPVDNRGTSYSFEASPLF